MSLWSERVLVALPHDHPLSSRETVYWTDLRGETVLPATTTPERSSNIFRFPSSSGLRSAQKSGATTSVAASSKAGSA